jgi:hypothetical protein
MSHSPGEDKTEKAPPLEELLTRVRHSPPKISPPLDDRLPIRTGRWPLPTDLATHEQGHTDEG